MSLRLLADSHVLVWWTSNPDFLTDAARRAIADPANEVLMSTASLWELGLKVAKGRLGLVPEFSQVLRADGFTDLPILARHAERALALPQLHGDPFDRMLIAQALEEGLVLLSRDRWMSAYGVRQIVA